MPIGCRSNGALPARGQHDRTSTRPESSRSRRSLDESIRCHGPVGLPMSHSWPNGSVIRPMRQPCSSLLETFAVAPASTALCTTASGSSRRAAFCSCRPLLPRAEPAISGPERRAWIRRATRRSSPIAGGVGCLIRCPDSGSVLPRAPGAPPYSEAMSSERDELAQLAQQFRTRRSAGPR